MEIEKLILKRIIEALKFYFDDNINFEIVDNKTVDIIGYTLNNLKWNEKEFNQNMLFLDNIKVENGTYNIYTSYDVSGFDYWNNNMNESMYCNLVIEFKSTFLFNIETLKDDIKNCMFLLTAYTI